jgi:hypothetical protein
MQTKSSAKKPKAKGVSVAYVEHTKSDIEEAILSAAFLLEFAGGDACGVAPALRMCARNVSRFLYTQDDIRKCGGDPSILWRKGMKDGRKRS